MPPKPSNAARMVSSPPVPELPIGPLPDPDEDQQAHRELEAQSGIPHGPRALSSTRLRGLHGAKLFACEIFRKLSAVRYWLRR